MCPETRKYTDIHQSDSYWGTEDIGCTQQGYKIIERTVEEMGSEQGQGGYRQPSFL